VARGFVSLVVSGKVVVSLAKTCAGLLLNFTGTLTGRGHVRRLNINTQKAWLLYHGLTAIKGVVTLYKRVNDRWTTDRGTDYSPPRCAALSGQVGKQATCGIYEWRPSPCREFEEGSDACQRARMRHGLARLN